MLIAYIMFELYSPKDNKRGEECQCSSFFHNSLISALTKVSRFLYLPLPLTCGI